MPRKNKNHALGHAVQEQSEVWTSMHTVLNRGSVRSVHCAPYSELRGKLADEIEGKREVNNQRRKRFGREDDISWGREKGDTEAGIC